MQSKIELDSLTEKDSVTVSVVLESGKKAAWAYAYRIRDETFYLSVIHVIHEYRGRGYGTVVLETLKDYISLKSYCLLLDVIPNGGLSYAELKAFYLRHGFKQYESEDSMLYCPS